MRERSSGSWTGCYHRVTSTPGLAFSSRLHCTTHPTTHTIQHTIHMIQHNTPGLHHIIHSPFPAPCIAPYYSVVCTRYNLARLFQRAAPHFTHNTLAFSTRLHCTTLHNTTTHTIQHKPQDTPHYTHNTPHYTGSLCYGGHYTSKTAITALHCVTSTPWTAFSRRLHNKTHNTPHYCPYMLLSICALNCISFHVQYKAQAAITVSLYILVCPLQQTVL